MGWAATEGDKGSAGDKGSEGLAMLLRVENRKRPLRPPVPAELSPRRWEVAWVGARAGAPQFCLLDSKPSPATYWLCVFSQVCEALWASVCPVCDKG